MKKSASQLRQAIVALERQRKSQVEYLLGERGPLRAGSFVRVRRKCGKPNCHCAQGEGHQSAYLSVKHEGRTRMIYVPKELEVLWEKEAERYRRFRTHRAKLVKLFEEQLRLVDQLQRSLAPAQDRSAANSPRSRKNKPKR